MGRDALHGACLARTSPHFNPRAPCGARLLWFKYSTEFIYFNPRAPCGARRTEHGEAVIREKFQSTRPVWGATKAAAGDRPRQLISIHAPRVGRDGLHALFVQQGRISIHAPRVGRDAQPGERSWLCADFNPRAPCGARLQLSPLPMYGSGISIHAPRVGRDSGRRLAALRTTTFQSTRPVWGATTRTTGRACRHGQFQSTRPVWGATRAGSLSLSLSTYFNPRAPCGARLQTEFSFERAAIFQSTRPVWGATTILARLSIPF